ncbi:prepilin-type N-terminal cleavage/methylation domain-containing protein [Candidatus Dependentiae bacterium]|nr:prepilin-type N-terminal cleavage/methylation domain-containing protein [Candidatus Dependentiae bacterium]
MKNSNAFTLMELLLALSVSGFIIIGMMQGFRNTEKILSKSRSILQINRSVCLLFNQIERDFNTAIIPTIAKIEKTKDKKIEEKKIDEKKDKVNFFFAESTEEDEKIKIGEKKYEFFKRVSFVNTNPLQIWGQKRSKLVRVGYELVKNKHRSNRENISYDLYRKETFDLSNTAFKTKEAENLAQKEISAISKQLVATNIKGMFLEYGMPKPKDKDDLLLISEKQEEQQLELFSWGKIKETKNVVPQTVEMHIVFWDEGLKSEKMFSCSIPIFSYPTQKKQAEKKEDKKNEPAPQPRR